MKTATIRKILVIALIGLFSQFSLAQDAGSALKQIADIVVSINHVPSDADKATLNAIAGNSALPEGLRGMASAVANINHSANDEGKAALAAVTGNAQAPDNAKALAGIIAELNHTASAEAKATLAQLFP